MEIKEQCLHKQIPKIFSNYIFNYKYRYLKLKKKNINMEMY